MKKFIKITALLIAILCISAAFAGCQITKSNYEKLCDNVSYMQTGLFVANDDNFDVKLTTTTQEELFIADGKVDSKVDLATLTILPRSAADLSKTFEYTLEGSLSSASGSIAKSRLGINLVCNIDNMASVGEPKTLTLSEGEDTFTLEFVNVCADITDGNGALNIAYTHFQEKIDAALAEDSFDRECYVKLLCQTNDANETEYFWYVSFIKNKRDYWAAIVNPTTDEIVSSRESVKEQDKVQGNK
ncbi:MAG: hypothetical protein K2G37_04380 [Clostridia bacterium]|nr:hypothetical protein [Clostridia bacterium]MDE7329088.1 hypothetical protein [Clostridia bacterium]